ncbi:MAG: hypothetical protein Q4C48_09025 [Lachnospiraceae bacterium]|nr:hypothetical protein [Lachnospiraceae bacterium]
MRDIKNNGKGIFVDNTVNNYFNPKNCCAHNSTPIKKKETTLGEILKKSIVQCLVSVLATLISFVVSRFYKVIAKNPSKTLFLITKLLFIILIITSVMLIICFLGDCINVLLLRKNGQFVTMMSRKEMINSLFTSSQSTEGAPVQSEQIVGKAYKNIDGKIYEIISKPCPFCETPPIGTMYLRRKKNSKSYTWVCNEQPAHCIDFDYKKKF